ncbi:MAG: hypothetical protein K6T61_03450 [Bryobacteraceae bacterium]|nr:hypothetical protein [Bryobacteraceae bacterium]
MKRESTPAEERLQHAEEPPPFGGSWGRLYAAVLGWLALLILLFYLFSRRFAP